MNTASNSRPLAACTVISCIASLPSSAWLSPASSEACDRKAASGVVRGAASASASMITPSSDTVIGDSSAGPACGAAAAVTPALAGTSCPTPCSARKAAAAFTSSRRFSMRS